MKTLLHASEPKTLTVSAAAAVASGGGRPPFPPPPLLPSLCGGGGGGVSRPAAGGVHVAACAAQVHTGECPCEGPAPAMTLATGRDTGHAQPSCLYCLLSHWGSAASCVLAVWPISVICCLWSGPHPPVAAARVKHLPRVPGPEPPQGVRPLEDEKGGSHEVPILHVALAPARRVAARQVEAVPLARAGVAHKQGVLVQRQRRFWGTISTISRGRKDAMC